MGYEYHCSKAKKKNVLVLVIGRVDFDANKKNVNHRRSTQFLTIRPTMKTKTCMFSNFNLQHKILLCLAWFTTIPGTFEMFSQTALDI